MPGHHFYKINVNEYSLYIMHMVTTLPVSMYLRIRESFAYKPEMKRMLRKHHKALALARDILDEDKRELNALSFKALKA